MTKSLCKVYFSHPTGQYIKQNYPPLEKILGASLMASVLILKEMVCGVNGVNGFGKWYAGGSTGQSGTTCKV